jgi:predicted nucleic acid-binding protein
VIVVADTSVLINLCRVGQGGLFKSLFGEVVIPPAVALEFTQLAARVPRFAGLTMPAGVREQSPTLFSPVVCTAAGLDPGEAAALSLAAEIHADAVLLDERRGYEVACKLGLPVIGALGILLRAKRKGILREVRLVLQSLQQDAGFWISQPLWNAVLEQAGEVS